MTNSPSRRRESGFTLIELLAVVLVIMLLAGILLTAAGYVQRRMAIQTARAEISAVEAALEAYKSDWGYYPKSNPERISCDGYKEATNNWLLCRALTGTCTGCTKKYMTFPAQQMVTNALTRQPNFYDPWGNIFNYYNSPTSGYAVTNALPAGWVYAWPSYNTWRGGYSVGGQVNKASYDLFSYGPDKYTYVPGAVPQGDYQTGNNAWYNGSQGGGWTNTAFALDDIANWNR